MITQTYILMTTLFLGGIAFAEPPEDDLLAGPTIVDEEVTEQDMLSRKMQETGKSSKIGSRQQAKLWRSALVSLEFTKEQSVSMEALKSEFEESQRAFQKEYGKELSSLRKEQNEAKKNDNMPSTELRTRMMEIMELSPDITAFQEKIWVLLSADQHSAFQVKYKELNDAELKQKEERKNRSKPKDEMQDGGFAPKDSRFRERDMKPEGDAVLRHKDSVDERTLRRIKFLRRLQQLEKEN
jgi:hypothetical protein